MTINFYKSILIRTVKRRSGWVLSGIVFCIFIFTTCTNHEYNKYKGKQELKEVSFKDFAGSATCANCHKVIYNTHLLTEHYSSSAPATAENILGSFEESKNRFVFTDAVYVQMEKIENEFFQTVYKNNQPVIKGKFDIVVGSGRKGQSYLRWAHDTLVQMPITFFTPEEKWTNSPGYPPKKVVFNRVVTSRCMECHSTYMQVTSVPGAEPEQFDKSNIIYGIDCERCHGPAALHVKFQMENPENKEAKFIINISELSRQQNLDLCSLCHGGKMEKTKPSFSFSTGDLLKDYFKKDSLSPDVTNIDVHGNQFGLLNASKCFQLSQMTCITCHDTHQNEQNKIEIFSQRCMQCHSSEHNKICKLKERLGSVVNQNCIDCHMPKQPSHAVAVYLQGAATPTPAMMRTHYIKAYPEETVKVIEYLKKINRIK
jgi:hypothetical protein